MCNRSLLWFNLIACSVCGCAASQTTLVMAPPRPGARGIVFAVDGAGDYHAASVSLRRAIDEANLPLNVETFAWSHGPGRILADQIDYAYARAQGRRLAATVCAYRQNHPGGAVYLLSHSAGSAVILAAAENLPPESVERIILLSPSVSSAYDLRPALRSCRCSLDVYSSRRDFWSLGVAVALIGTTDRQPGSAAGRAGFVPRSATPEDAALYAKLRQHPWEPCLEWTGNHGSHYGTYRDTYLRAYVLPLLR